jgi:hypothetical protein
MSRCRGMWWRAKPCAGQVSEIVESIEREFANTEASRWTKTPSPMYKRMVREHIEGDVEVRKKTQCCSSCGRR